MPVIKDIILRYGKIIDSFEVELILAHVLKKKREFVLAHSEQKLTAGELKKVKELIARRRKKEPLAYLLGEKEFFGLPFSVNRKVLIPRPETELLIEAALAQFEKNSQTKKGVLFFDIGTGCGNLIITLAKKILENKNQIDDLYFFAVDISPHALSVAKKNARRHKLQKKIIFVEGDLLEPLIKKIKVIWLQSKTKNYQREKKIIFLLANLPYLTKKNLNLSCPEVRLYEPKSALLSHKSGLSHYYRLLLQMKKLPSLFANNLQIFFFFEIQPGQKNKIEKLIKKFFPVSQINFFKDLAGRWRLVSGKIVE